jgi:hypothetical protein
MDKNVTYLSVRLGEASSDQIDNKGELLPPRTIIKNGRYIGIRNFGPETGDLDIYAMEDLLFMKQSDIGSEFIGSKTDSRIVIDHIGGRVIVLGDIKYYSQTPEVIDTNAKKILNYIEPL